MATFPVFLAATMTLSSSGYQNLVPDVRVDLSNLQPNGVSFCDQDGYKQVWGDEFEGSELNESHWQITLGSNGGQLRNAWGTADNVYVQNGTLVLRSQAQKTNGFNFTSGAVTSKDKAYWSKGRVCVSAMLPGGSPDGGLGQGIWPAHWMMPNDNSCWPDHGEIDIMEMINADGYSHGTYHWNKFYPGKPCQYQAGNSGISAEIKLPETWYSSYHEFAVEFDLEKQYLHFVVDSQVIITINETSKDYKGDHAQFGPSPFYLILNTAVEGPWPGPVNSSTRFPAYHTIDYVRVSQL